jgi:hypothetical protein
VWVHGTSPEVWRFLPRPLPRLLCTNGSHRSSHASQVFISGANMVRIIPLGAQSHLASSEHTWPRITPEAGVGKTRGASTTPSDCATNYQPLPSTQPTLIPATPNQYGPSLTSAVDAARLTSLPVSHNDTTHVVVVPVFILCRGNVHTGYSGDPILHFPLCEQSLHTVIGGHSHHAFTCETAVPDIQHN